MCVIICIGVRVLCGRDGLRSEWGGVCACLAKSTLNLLQNPHVSWHLVLGMLAVLERASHDPCIFTYVQLLPCLHTLKYLKTYFCYFVNSVLQYGCFYFLYCCKIVLELLFARVGKYSFLRKNVFVNGGIFTFM